MQHVKLLADFFKTLKLDELRVERPDPFIFFCGGVVHLGDLPAPFRSLRDYIHRRPLKLKHRIVLAESAVKLFQESQYNDLITFEAHIAQISELVLLVCESPGSLAELGAFCLKDAIVERIYVIIQEQHAEADSFVRLGPLRVIERENPDAVGAIPWEEGINANKEIEITIDAQYDDVIVKAVDQSLTKPKSEKFKMENDGHRMILLYWACFMLRAATKKELLDFFEEVSVKADSADLDRYMYCMIVAGWIQKKNIGRQYFVPHHDRDPFRYAYQNADPANLTKAANVKAAIADYLKREGLRPPQIIDAIGAGDPPEVLK